MGDGDDETPGAERDYGDILWAPTAQSAENAEITRYARWLASHGGPAIAGAAPGELASYRDLWRWSVDEPAAFWSSIWDFFGVLGSRGDGPVLAGEMPDAAWFEGSTLNYARNALFRAAAPAERTAVAYRAETGRTGTLSYGELRAEVGRVQAGLRQLGVGLGDRVAAYLPNSPEALIAMLATTSLGAIWTSCSPDFGSHSVIDRFAQITPKVLLGVDAYVYHGKSFDRRPELAAIAAGLDGLQAVVLVDYLRTGAAMTGLPAGVTVLNWASFGAAGGPDAASTEPEFTDVPFGHPLWVLYSSGTTGLPKPIVHGHGGVVVEHLKALALHQDLTSSDTFFWYTTTGWMMWNYVVGGLLTGGTVVLYDGSATYPASGELWALAAQTGVTYFGAGAPYLLACRKAGMHPASEYDLSRLKGIGSTGSPLPPEGFRWVYEELRTGSPGLILGSYSGGTDLCTGFVGPSPLLPVRAGVISGPCLGAKVEAFDPAGRPVIGEVGELVLTAPMPSMPVGFWNDPGGKRYRDSYFAEYPGVWRHGDWIMIRPDGGCVIYGRSDATLNRGGVRMGTSEFYRVVEALPEIADSLVVDTGQLGQDGRLILFVVPADGQSLDDALIARIRSALRAELSPRHVPDEIHQVPGIPRTLSGKKLEVPVRRILQGTPVAVAADPDALANPEVLGHFALGADMTESARGATPATPAGPSERSFGEEGGLLTYGRYLRLPELLGQQVLNSSPPVHDEMLFIVVHQTYELWFKELLHELTAVRDVMTAATRSPSGQDRPVWLARQLLRRVHVIERLLVSQVDVLETMTPQDFGEFRTALAPASGFQSVQFRELEFLSGAKDPGFVRRFRSLTDSERARLTARLAEPSLWDAYVDLLASRGLPVGSDNEILTALATVARDREHYDDLWELAEDLLTHDELAALWRARHVQMVERQIGTKSGTGGSTGAPYLHGRVPMRYYPLLWELRDWL